MVLTCGDQQHGPLALAAVGLGCYRVRRSADPFGPSVPMARGSWLALLPAQKTQQQFGKLLGRTATVHRAWSQACYPNQARKAKRRGRRSWQGAAFCLLVGEFGFHSGLCRGG